MLLIGLKRRKEDCNLVLLSFFVNVFKRVKRIFYYRRDERRYTNMKVYGLEIRNQKSEELNHRLSFLKRNLKLTDSIGDVKISFNHRQEILIIKEELLRRGA